MNIDDCKIFVTYTVKLFLDLDVRKMFSNVGKYKLNSILPKEHQSMSHRGHPFLRLREVAYTVLIIAMKMNLHLQRLLDFIQMSEVVAIHPN